MADVISERLKKTIGTTPDWYRDAEFIELYQRLFSSGQGTELPEVTEETWEVIAWFAQALLANEVVLGQARDGYNDDDRAGQFAGATPAEVDAVIVHHTATKEDLTWEELNALGLLRLYLPHFMDANPNSFIKFLLSTHPDLADKGPLAPTSGHYVMQEGKEVQVFAGYHVLIYSDGRIEYPLGRKGFDYMAFHAGNYNVNARSLGVAFVGDFSQGAPTLAAQEAFKLFLMDLREENITISYLDAHTHVKLGDTECPGPWYEKFRESEEFADLKTFQPAS